MTLPILIYATVICTITSPIAAKEVADGIILFPVSQLKNFYEL